jgi:hypothetical protein
VEGSFEIAAVGEQGLDFAHGAGRRRAPAAPHQQSHLAQQVAGAEIGDGRLAAAWQPGADRHAAGGNDIGAVGDLPLPHQGLAGREAAQIETDRQLRQLRRRQVAVEGRRRDRLFDGPTHPLPPAPPY